MKKFLVCLFVLIFGVCLVACGGQNVAETSSLVEEVSTVESVTTTEPTTTTATITTTKKTTTTTKATTTTKDASAGLVNGMRPEFKNAMDTFERFYDKYCSFMKKYMANPSDLTLLSEYASMTSDLLEMDKELQAWEGKDMNAAETKYYVEMTGRISKKLLEVAQ